MCVQRDARFMQEQLRHGAAAELLGKKYDVAEGVGCESCHGAGADYKKKKIMEDRRLLSPQAW